MSRQLEELVRNLPRAGRLVKDRGYRQVWRFEHGGRAYYLKFYPRTAGRLKRLFRGSPAMREFLRLQWLQKANVLAPRAVATLMGLRLNDAVGDAVILEAIEPGRPLDDYLNELERKALPVPHRRELARQVTDLVKKLAQAELGHADLHLGNILMSGGALYLLDAYAVHRGGMTLDDLLLLGGSAERWATRTELLRGWRALGDEGRLPKGNPPHARFRRKFMERIFGDNRYFAALRVGEWAGACFRFCKHSFAWSKASRLRVSPDDWAAQWPTLNWNEWELLKQSRSGEVRAGQLNLDGETIAVVAKRPRRRYWYRYVNEIGRGGRARRAWIKAWRLISHGIPTAWPLALLEKRRGGYVTDAVIVSERVEGPTLAVMDWSGLSQRRRRRLFHRVGAILRRLEAAGMYHWDAKSSNWIVTTDPAGRPAPVLVDVDGIRRNWGKGEGLRRLLVSLRQRPDFSAEDEQALRVGYRPWRQ